MNIPDLFDKCVQFINHLPKTEMMSVENKLLLYKYFKQGTIGKCNIVAPSMFRFEERKKYEAWKSIENLSKEEAKKKYVETVSSIYPNWNKEK
ncbi:acyl-CoA binding protein, putative [Plasmodium ovale wallikeri]|uniref:Acyl-CoA binding protein, putative n=2 Tax=Plasmodium ovale TaxID=36330 RepID=A0A1A8ZY25_PLAOA|nr:acyl-CoA binding protein, putative [Plasmodium ovale wallikeri]SBT48793.1 acyl-CoA binding protein, putative [Plasmodium ovale wallikeri]SBT82454.1 acyl-CoA binding protein, putative [Plasmodium ovale]